MFDTLVKYEDLNRVEKKLKEKGKTYTIVLLDDINQKVHIKSGEQCH